MLAMRQHRLVVQAYTNQRRTSRSACVEIGREVSCLLELTRSLKSGDSSFLERTMLFTHPTPKCTLLDNARGRHLVKYRWSFVRTFRVQIKVFEPSNVVKYLDEPPDRIGRASLFILPHLHAFIGGIVLPFRV